MFNPNKLLMRKIQNNGGFVNAHAHFDRAFTVTENNMEEVVNYHLFDKWSFVDKFKKKASVEDYFNNFKQAIDRQLALGVVAGLSFVDIDSVSEFRAIEAAQLAKKYGQENGFTLKIASQALKGVIAPTENKLLRKALEMDYLDVIGGLPKVDKNYESAHLDQILFLGREYNKRVHVHVDQLNVDNETETEDLALATIKHKMYGKVTAVHSISLACHHKIYRERVYNVAKDAGLSFITCPTAWIDSRRSERLSPTHNSITPVEEMLKHNLVVAIGSDNIQDVYKPFSDGNMYLEVKFLLESLHLYNIDALVKIATDNGRLVIGMEDDNGAEKI
jgi:cytosine/adenosine deaminase-related metal-dependent hydrolase